MKKIIIILFGCAAIFACKTAKKTTATEPAKEPVCPKILLTYNNNIKPIMDANCAGCHSGNRPAHGIDLSNYENVKLASTKPNFLGSIQHLTGFDKMPAGHAKLDDSVIQTINCWITNGTSN